MKRTAAIGFDRRVRREWLDAIASRCATGATVPELRRFGHRLLRTEHPAKEARGKTLTVLFHLWVTVPAKALNVRDRAIKLFEELDPAQRICLHWGLALATYPFFRDASDSTGRLLALQGAVSLAQIQRRVAERWGRRSTTERAAQRIVRSWIDWGVLRESDQRGTYVQGKPIAVASPIASWLVEAMLIGADAEPRAVARVNKAPELFPFDLKISAHELRRAPRLIIHRQGLDEDIVALRPARDQDQRAERGQLQYSLLRPQGA